MPTPIAHYQPTPRIVQYNKKRYALRLEEIYWNCLQDIANTEKKRIGELVHQMHQSYSGKNFSSYIRVICMIETQKKLGQSDGQQWIGSTDIIKSSPTPALILNHVGLIIDSNPAFHRWMNEPDNPFLNGRFTNYFTPLHSRSFESTLELMTTKRLKRTQMPVSYNRQNGKQQTSTITALDITSKETSFFRALIWFNTQPALRIRVQ